MNPDYYHQVFKNIINNSKFLIDKNIYKFLVKLFYFIFLKTDESFKKYELKELNKKIRYINNFIKNEGEKLNDKYENKNLINVIKFVKTQNSIYTGEIIENLLIITFSFAFKTEKENTFGKYIYNNIGILKNSKNYDLAKWFIKEKIIDKLPNIRELLKNDILERHNFLNKIQEEAIFDLLFYIYIEKTYLKIIQRKKCFNYINRNNYKEKANEIQIK